MTSIPIDFLLPISPRKILQKMVIANIFQIVGVELIIFNQTFTSLAYVNKNEVLNRK
jgi:hypothetical protein